MLDTLFKLPRHSVLICQMKMVKIYLPVGVCGNEKMTLSLSLSLSLSIYIYIYMYVCMYIHYHSPDRQKEREGEYIFYFKELAHVIIEAVKSLQGGPYG